MIGARGTRSTAEYLEAIWPHTVIVGALGGILAVVLRFFAPRIWDLFQTPLERWLKRELSDSSDRQRLAQFRQALLVHLKTLDTDSCWQHHRLVPLDAEIDALHGNRKRRRVMDLSSGIRAYRRARLFRVIGDPGSGKRWRCASSAATCSQNRIGSARFPFTST